MRAWLTRRPARWDRGDWAVAAAATLLVAARWGERARFLMSWDSDTFSLALERYDVQGLRPHAPGYPLYVALGRLVYPLAANANDAYIALSLAFTATALTLAYWLGRRMRNRAIGLGAALLLAAAPVAFVHSVTANVYTADLAAGLAVACAAWHCRRAPTPAAVATLAAAFALAVGLRPSIAMFLAPLALWAVLRPPWRLPSLARRLLPGAALGAAIGLAWFLPMARASGGVAAWREANRLQSRQVVFGHTIWSDGPSMLYANLGRLGLYLRWELRTLAPVLAAMALAWALLRLRGARRGRLPTARFLGARPEGREQAAFLAFWALPALLFYALVFSGWNEGPSGYILVVLPALVLACVLLAASLAARLRALAGPGLASVALAAFLLVPMLTMAAHRHDVADVDYRAHDDWADSWMALPGTFPPSNTSIVASWSFAHAWWHFPDYTVYNYRPPAEGPGEVPDFLLIQQARGHEATPDWYASIAERRTATPHPLPPGTRQLVLFDFQLAGESGGPRQVRGDVEVREAWLDNGWRILLVPVTPDRPLLEDYFTMEGAVPPWPA